MHLECQIQYLAFWVHILYGVGNTSLRKLFLHKTERSQSI